ncbi:MAG: integration host factor subunit beta [Deltaproteobacteria bacterium]|nr:integration host factor subunit beta [Deltaproteobacteria bacterium]
MTKSELIEQLSEHLKSLSRNEVEIIVDTMFNKMTEALQNGDRIELRGFGTFEVRERPARQGRNPKTGATVYVKNRKVPFFKVGKELKDRVNDAFLGEQNQDNADKTQTLSGNPAQRVVNS